MPNTRILLIRHGQSEWNADGRWQGQADPPLTDLGREQAKRAAPHLPKEITLWVASTLQRAHETAVLLSKAKGMNAPHPEPLLMERSAGEFEGLTKMQINEQYPGYLGSGRWPEGWEDEASLQNRIEGGLRKVAKEFPGECIGAVSHGGVIRMLIESAGRECPSVSNLGALWVEVSADGEIEIGARTDLLPMVAQTVPGQI